MKCRGGYEIQEGFDFQQNTACEYFPCHESVDASIFSCKFCYCPLYLVDECEGDYSILDNGLKDCSNCSIPHKGKDGYAHVINILSKEVF